jgi:hypothetical protein
VCLLERHPATAAAIAMSRAAAAAPIRASRAENPAGGAKWRVRSGAPLGWVWMLTGPGSRVDVIELANIGQ